MTLSCKCIINASTSTGAGEWQGDGDDDDDEMPLPPMRRSRCADFGALLDHHYAPNGFPVSNCRGLVCRASASDARLRRFRSTRRIVRTSTYTRSTNTISRRYDRDEEAAVTQE